MPQTTAAIPLFALLAAACAGAQLQCPTGESSHCVILWGTIDCRLRRTTERNRIAPAGLPGGSKYLLCLAGSNTPSPQPDPYPIQLGYSGINFLQQYAGIYGPDAVRLFRSVPDYVMHHNSHSHKQHLQAVVTRLRWHHNVVH